MAPEHNYEPGGANCAPQKLQSLPAKAAAKEQDRCAQAREDHSARQRELAEQVRANDIAEWNLWLAFRQAQYSLAQTIATGLAFLAAAIAAIIAWRAAVWAREAARETKRSADAAMAQLEAVRVAERAYLCTAYYAAQDPEGRFTIKAENSGRTHAHVWEVWYTTVENLPKSPALRKKNLSRLDSDIVVTPGKSDGLAVIAVVDPAHQHILGYIDFRDVYAINRRLHFRYDRQPNNHWTMAGGVPWNAAK